MPARTRIHYFNEGLDTVLTSEAEAAGQHRFTGTKVIATIGPSCQDVAVMKDLMLAGMVGARVDLTWGPLDFHRKSLANLQTAMRDAHRLCCCVVDTLGREVMVRGQVSIDANGWPMHEAVYEVEAGQTITLTCRLGAEPSASCLPLSYDRFTEMAQKGDTVYVGRYLVSGADSASLYLEVIDVVGEDVICEAKNAARLTGLLTVFHAERSHDSLANVQNMLPILSQYDMESIAALAKEFELDYISLSYTRSADDVREARAFLASIGCSTTRILAKVETRQALLNLNSILEAADGIIMSRGNLGLDCLPEKMALIQKTLVQACNLVGKPVIITRVVDTMAETPRPTRAEATDVANAVLDGADGILLGAETLRGKYPLDTVKTICRIARAAEAVFNFQDHMDFLMETALETEEQHASRNREALAPLPARLQPAGGSTASLDSSELNLSVSVLDLQAHAHTSGAATHGLSRLATASTAADGPAAINLTADTRTSAQLMYQMDSGSSSSLVGKARMVQPVISKLEAIAGSAVRAAEKVGARMILVYTHTGMSAALVAKYKPPVPILSLVVPTLRSNGLSWYLEGRIYARQSLLTRGVMPMLVTPSAQGEEILEEAMDMACHMGLVKAADQVVCVQSVHGDYCVKIIRVADVGGKSALLAVPKVGSQGMLHVAVGKAASYAADVASPGAHDFERISVGAAYDPQLRHHKHTLVPVASMRYSSALSNEEEEEDNGMPSVAPVPEE